MSVTKRDAEAVLRAVRKQYGFKASDQYGPVLVKDWAFLDHPAPWAVVWEEGPYEWAIRFPEGGIDEEATIAVQEFRAGAVVRTPAAVLPAGVWTEALTSFAIGIYEA